MLSALAQGYGTWDGLTNISGLEALPALDLPNDHKHGITVKSARRQKPKIVRVEEVGGCIHIPKTYLTRKGALVLYSSPKEIENDKNIHKPVDVEKVIQRLGNVRRLMASILYLNDCQSSDPDMSISDEKNEVFMGFLKTIDSVLYKQRLQPGHDLNFYLKSLRMRARKIADIAGSDIAYQIHALLCTPAASSRPSTSGTTGTSGTRAAHKLSSAKLTASLKSDSYMGRKISYPALDTLSVHEPSDTPFSISTWPHYTQHTPRAFDGKEKLAESKNEVSSQRSHSTGHTSEAPNLDVRGAGGMEVPDKARATSAYSTASGSLVEDATLYEEVDISLPSETGGPEPDSDLENEYFNSVLNVDDLPRPGLPDLSAKVDKETLVSSSIDRHLTNTPDVESSFIDVEVKESMSMTPEITLRSGNSEMFNILQSHVSDDTTADKSERRPRLSFSHSARDRRTSRTEDKRRAVTARDRNSFNDHSIRGADAEGTNVEGTQSTRSADQTSYRSSLHSSNSPTESSAANNIQVDVKFGTSMHLPKLKQREGDSGRVEGITPDPLSQPLSAASHDTDQTRPYSRESMQESTHSAKSKTSSIADISRTGSAHAYFSLMDKENLQLPVSGESDAVSTISTSPASFTLLTAASVAAPCTMPASVLVATPDKLPTAMPAVVPAAAAASHMAYTTALTVLSMTSAATPTAASTTVQTAVSASTTVSKLSNNSTAVSSVIKGVGRDQHPSAHSATYRMQSDISTPRDISNRADPLIEVKHILTEDNTKKASDAVNRLPSTSSSFSKHKLADAPKGSKVRDADKEALKIAEKMRIDDQKALEALMKEPEEVKEMLASSMMDEFDESGLTMEEMELAREMLEQKMAEAGKGIKQTLTAKSLSEKKGEKNANKFAKLAQQAINETSKAKRKEFMEKRDRIRQTKRLEQQRRTAERKALQEIVLIKAKEEQAFLAAEEKRIQVIMERERYMNAIAEEARQQEEEARKALAKSRHEGKIERERRRKEDLEIRKEEAIRRREEQRRMQDSARQKELDMLEKISDAETVRSLREEERKRREDEEWKLQAKLMEEERMSSLRAEDEEARIRNIEREAEEGAMARIIEERMDAERKERELEQQRRHLQEREEERKALVERERSRIEEELRLKEEEERKELEAERQRILELKRLEIEAQEQMKQEMEDRRAELIRLREANMDKKRNMETIKKNQACTKPWVFSYYVKWPRESYERMMGAAADKKRRPAPRKKTS